MRKRKTRSKRSNLRSNFSRNSGFARRHDNSEEVVARFKETSFGLIDGANFTEADDDEVISKKALIIVEGNHTDNSGKKHSFTAEDIDWFADSTNDFLATGGRVPWQQDHNKSQTSNIGDLESNVVAKVITYDDLPNPKLGRSLVGKLGLFATELVGKGKDVVDQIRAGRIKTLSPGIDMATGIIREISATPTPAIKGMSVFSRGSSKGMSATNWEEAESHIEMDDRLKEEFDQLTETFWNITSNIVSSSDDEMPMNNRDKVFNEAVDGYVKRLTDLLGIDEENSEYYGGKADTTQNEKGSEKVQAQHRTEKISLSAKLNEMNNFSRSRRNKKSRTIPAR